MNAHEMKFDNIVELLLSDTRIDLNIVDKFGESFLLMTYKNHELFSYLIHKDDIDLNVINKKGYSPLHLAVENNYFDVVSFILDSEKYKIPIDSRTQDGSSLIHLAIFNNSMELLNILEEKGLNYNLQDKKGLTPLMKLIKQKSPHADIFFTIFNEPMKPGKKIVEIWIELMKKDLININIKDNRGILIFFSNMAVIHYAAMSKKSELFPSLFERKDLDINMKSFTGIKIIHLLMKPQ